MPTTNSAATVVAAVAPEVQVVEEALELVWLLSKVGVPVKPWNIWTATFTLVSEALKATETVGLAPV